MEPTTEQSAILELSRGEANLMISALAGCVAEGTIISTRRGNDLTVRKRPIERLLHLRKPEIPTLILSNVNGYAEYQPMKGCFYSGIKETVRMETYAGEVIATPDHQVQTENGWAEIGNIKPKDLVYSRITGNTERKTGRTTIYSVQHHPFANQHNIGNYGNYKRIYRARLVIEAHLNNLTLEEMILIIRHDPYKAAGLKYIQPDHIIHHINEDPSDDRLENLEVLLTREHLELHKAHLSHTKLRLIPVISVTAAGRRHTYDIMMPSPHHNFLANGHVVHNCGKTSTLELIERAVTTKPILYLCFNKKIAESATKRMLTTTTVRTFNSLGHRIWAKAVGKNLSLAPRKTQDLLRSLIDEIPKRDQGPVWDCFWEIVHGVALAKALGYVPEGKFPNAKRLTTRADFHTSLDEDPDDFTADLIDTILLRSIKAAYAGSIDYNDQVYMPALFGGIFPRFPLVLVDEAQDLNPVNHALLDKLVKHRLIAVGDPYQSIYGFRGAVQGGMASLAARFSTTPTDLSVSFRCPQAIVENARWRAPHFKWIKPGGHVETLTSLAPSAILDTSVILCRNNGPIFAVALRLLAAGRSVSVSGSDIGPKVIGLMRKLGPESTPQVSVLSAIDGWLEERLARGSTTAQDLADCMKVFASHGETLAQAIAYAEHLFSQQGTIRLMTGHKAKGLEFETVFHLDPWLCRSDEQDANLRYVIQTRSLDRYYEINSGDIKW